MRLHFIGANSGNVTGSRYLLEAKGKKILLDSGLYQGRRKESALLNSNLPFDAAKIDFILLSHAHIDHSGNLPFLVKNGFSGPIYTTTATKDLCHYMLLDSAHIQEREVEYLKKKGCEICEPHYSEEDARRCISLFQGINYEESFEVSPGIKVIFREAGHILGSATITITVEEDTTKTLIYSGDLGRKGLPILRDPVQVESGDYLILESTYGNRYHESVQDIEPKFREIVKKVAAKGGKMIVPAFSLERTQEVVYHLHRIWDSNSIPQLPIFVDSPLAGNLTEVFSSHPECFDEETLQEFKNHADNPFGFSSLTYTKNVEESKALSEFKGPCVIISSAGMCEHGRILHHLRNNIEDPRTTIMIVGYMAKDTLGRKILEKSPRVNILGDSFKVNADVEVVDAFSGHADKSDLLAFADHVKGLKKIFLVHGELDQQEALQKALAANSHHDVSIPKIGDSFEL